MHAIKKRERPNKPYGCVGWKVEQSGLYDTLESWLESLHLAVNLTWNLFGYIPAAS